MERLTVSLPEDTVRKIKRISRESGLKVSQIVSKALEQQLSEQALPPAEPPIHPTVLWKLKGRRYLKGPSPRLVGVRAGSWRIVDLDKLPL